MDTPESKKKVIAKVVKKSTTTRRVAKPVAVKKTSSKKASTPIPPKAETTVRKKRAPKSVLMTPLKRVDTDSVTILGGSLSLRLEERLAIYEMWYQKYAPQVGVPIAKYTGYTFIAVGVFTSYLSWSQGFIQNGQMAALLTSNFTAELSVPQNEEILLEANSHTGPALERASIQTPAVIPDSNTAYTVQALDAVAVSATVVSVETNETFEAGTPSVLGAEYSFMLPTAKLPPGNYFVRLEAESGRKVLSEYTTPVFTIKATSTSPSTGEVLGVATTTVTSSEPELTEPIASSTSEMSTTTESAESDNEIEQEAAPASLLDLQILPGVSPEVSKVIIVPTYDYDSVELYAIAEYSLVEYFLGTATKTDDDSWLYWLKTTDLPVGAYTLTARTLNDNQYKEQAAASLIIRPQTREVLTPAPEPDVLLLADIALVSASGTSEEEVIEESADQEATSSVVSTTEEVASEPVTFTEPDAALASLLSRYRSATLTNNPVLLRLIDDEFAKEISRRLTASGESATDTSESQALLLKTEFADQKQAVVNMLEQELSSGLAASDTDQDGISDAEETAVYGTDPTIADTDEDGVTDGVEIMRDLDPRAVETGVVRYQYLPQHTNLVETSVIALTSVRPLYSYLANESTALMQTKITGSALPNSFVTLYVFSEPIISSVRADAAGFFEYVLDKELPVGPHEVYAVLTDEMGAIVVQSPVFTFDKTEDGYSVSTATIMPETLPEPSDDTLAQTQNLVGAVGLVCFGLILVLLAAHLTHIPRRVEKTTPAPAI